MPERGTARCLLTSVFVALLLPGMAGFGQANEHSETENAKHPMAVESISTTVAPTVRVRALDAVGAHTAALLLSGQSGGNLPGAMVWCAEQDTDEEGRVGVLLFVELDGDALLEGPPSDRLPVVIAAYAIDEHDAVIGHLIQGVLIEGEGLQAALAPAGLKFIGKIAIPPGTVSLRLLVRVHGTERFFLTRKELHLPTPGSGIAAVSAPLFASPEVEWLEARQRGLSPPACCVDELVPAAVPVLDATRPMTFVAIASDWPEDARLMASVAIGQGRTIEQPQLSIRQTRLADNGKSETMEIEIPPIDVPQGAYRLTLQLLANTSEELAKRSLPVVLVHGEPTTGWAGLRKPADDGSRPVLATAVSEEEPKNEELQSDYLAALQMLAEGKGKDARRAIAELEHKVFAADPVFGHDIACRAELQVARALKKVNPQSLLPLLVLHHNMCHTYAAYREHVFSNHSAMVTAELAKIVWSGRKKTPVGDIAETALTSVAMELIHGGNPITGGDLLERALKLNSKFVPALMNLAALQERCDRRSKAVDLLQKLVASDPDNPEARLRLGVNLHRSGGRDNAYDVLQPLLQRSTPEWIRSITAQELAHILVKKGRLDEAEFVLIRAIDNVADQQTLAIQLSWTQELAGRSADATATLVRVEQDVGRRVDSARMKYSRWPDMDRYGFQSALRQVSEERLGDLRRALESRDLR